MTNSDPDNLVIRLAEASSPVAMRAVAIELSKPGATAKAYRHPAYGSAIRRLIGWVRDGAPSERLVALAVLARLRKQQRQPFAAELERLLSENMPPLEAAPQDVEDPKERDYLAQGLGLISFDGRQDYLARFVASDGQTRTDARDSATEVLLQIAPSLDSAFETLTLALRGQSHDTQDPATSRLRRLLRVMEALRLTLRTVEPPVGSETGRTFADLLQSGFTQSADRQASIEATTVALDLLLAWLRPNFSVAMEPEAFRGLQTLRNQFAPARWPDETEPGRRAIAKLIREAIALLAQAGVTDDRLRASLDLIVGDMSASAMLRELAKTLPGLSNEVRHWLETGRAPSGKQGSAAVEESVLETVDRDIAEAYRDASSANQLIRNVATDIEEAISLDHPGLAEAFDQVISRIRRVIRRLDSIAAKRGFELSGEVGAIVDYAPADHIGDRPIAGVRHVHIVSPMVVRRTQGGAPQMIIKAKVEEA